MQIPQLMRELLIAHSLGMTTLVKA